ncbi:MAG: HEAT repeat protein [Glaciecola sp.]|jgi:HEAT repeat protein
MSPAFPNLHKLFMLILLALTGAGQARAIVDSDPLKDLIDGMREGQVETAEKWLEVLSKQPLGTTPTLMLVFREDEEHDLLTRLESKLQEVSAFAFEQHARTPLEPAIWAKHCRISMEILALIGESPEARNLLGLLSPPRGVEQSLYDSRAFQSPLKQSLLQACERDEATLRVIQRTYGNQTRTLDSQLLRILGDCDALSTPDTLARCLGKRHTLDGIVLTQIAGALRKPHLHISEFGLGAVRPMLSNAVAYTRQSAARALGYADDTQSIRRLIQLLNDPSDSVRNETLKALHRITAMTIEGHPDRWRTWFDEETQWWLEDSRDTLRSLKDSTQKDVARTLRELSGKRLFRRELAPHVMAMLDDPRPEVVRLALATLESLRPPLTDLTPLLKGLVHHRSPIVRNDASRILRYLTTRANSKSPASTISRTR